MNKVIDFMKELIIDNNKKILVEVIIGVIVAFVSGLCVSLLTKMNVIIKKIFLLNHCQSLRNRPYV